MNQTGRYRLRPGAIGRPDASTGWKAVIDYSLALDRYVLAGVYMQTYTRITSMEGACESGRHAANALLKRISEETDGKTVGQDCEIWDPEDNEIEDLATLKALDEELMARGLPHMVDILQ